MVKLHGHATQVSQQLIGVGLLCEYAEGALQSLQLTRQLVVLLRQEGDYSCRRPSLEKPTQVNRQSVLPLRMTQWVTDSFCISTSTRPSPFQKVIVPLCLWKGSADLSQDFNQFFLFDFAKGLHQVKHIKQIPQILYIGLTSARNRL